MKAERWECDGCGFIPNKFGNLCMHRARILEWDKAMIVGTTQCWYPDGCIGIWNEKAIQTKVEE